MSSIEKIEPSGINTTPTLLILYTLAKECQDHNYVLPEHFFKCCCVCVSLSEIHEPNRDRGIGFPAVLSLLVLIGLIHILLPGKLLGNVLGDLPDELAGELEGWLVGCRTS